MNLIVHHSTRNSIIILIVNCQDDKLYLFFPYSVLLYLSLFGFTLDPRQYRDKFAPPRRFLDHVTAARYGSHFSASNMLLLPVSPEIIRQEVNVLISDLIVRLKQLLFNSLLCAYYVGFIPIQFTPVSYECLECVRATK